MFLEWAGEVPVAERFCDGEMYRGFTLTETRVRCVGVQGFRFTAGCHSAKILRHSTFVFWQDNGMKDNAQ